MTSTPDDIRRIQASRTAAWSRLLVLGMLACLLVVLGRVAQLKISPGAQLRPAMTPRLSTRVEPARRGDLLDARGRVLATSTVGYRLFIDPSQIKDPATIAVDLADLIGATPVEIDRTILAATSRRYVVIDHLLEDWQAQAVREAGLRGVGLQPRPVRHYPQGPLAAALVGMVGFEHRGLSGSEHVFEDRLTPQAGRLTYLRGARREALWIEPHDYRRGADGDSVRLSIDLVIQELAEHRLQEAVAKYNAGGGRIVVLDCRSGEILAMCDVLNTRPGREDVARDPVRATHAGLGRNRCVTDPYEPGSTLKPFIWAVATELGKATPGEIIPTPADRPYRTRYGRPIRDSHYHGSATWRTVLVESLNTGMAIVGERMTHAQMRDAVRRFGFGRLTRCGIPGESAGLLTPAARWSDYTQSSVAMGHEIAVTPVQMVQAFTAFARDGTLSPLRIIAADPRDTQYRFERRVCSPATARLVREVLRDVMEVGTGQRARSVRYQLFGKSGTAQLPRPEGGGYFEDRYVSSFIAGAPFADPRVVVLCVIDDPDRRLGHWGGDVAGPAVRDVIDGALEYLGVGAEEGIGVGD